MRRILVWLSLACLSPAATCAEPGKPTLPIEETRDVQGDPLPRHAWARLGTTRWRQGAPVISLAFHPRGNTLASSAEDGSVCIRSTTTGQELRRLTGHKGQVLSLAFDRAGTYVAAVAHHAIPDEVVLDDLLLWEYRTGKLLWARQAEREKGGLTSVSFSPDGRLIATGGCLDEVSFWDARTGERRGTIPYDRPPAGFEGFNPKGEVSFSPDGRFLACGLQNSKGYIWEVNSRKKVREFTNRNHNEQAVLFSPDGKQVVSVASRSKLAVWDTSTWRQTGTIPTDESHIFQFSPDGKLLAVGSQGARPVGSLCFWNLSTFKKVGEAPWLEPSCSTQSQPASGALAFSPDGRRLAWLEGGHNIHILDVSTRTENGLTRGTHAGLTSLSFFPDGRRLVTGSDDRTASLWDLRTLRRTHHCSEDFPSSVYAVKAVAAAPDGQTVAVGLESSLFLWHPAKDTKQSLGDEDGPRHEIRAIFFAPGGSTVIRGNENGEVSLWDTRNGKKVQGFRTIKPLHALALSSTGRFLALGGKDEVLQTWDLERGAQGRSMGKHPGIVGAVAFSPCENLVASANDKGVIHVWEKVLGKRCLTLQAGASVRCLAFSLDGRFLASGGEAREISLWDLATGRRAGTLSGHQGMVTALAFSPDGKTLATASSDTTALLWHWHWRSALHSDPPPAPLTAPQLQRCWDHLADPDSELAVRALWQLADAGEQGVAFLRKHLQPVQPVEKKTIARLVSRLDSDDFSERQEASRELEQLGDLAAPALLDVVEGKPSPEATRRARALLEKLENSIISPTKLRELRALMALERSKVPESLAFLKELAAGAADARLTRLARIALTRQSRKVPQTQQSPHRRQQGNRCDGLRGPQGPDPGNTWGRCPSGISTARTTPPGRNTCGDKAPHGRMRDITYRTNCSAA